MNTSESTPKLENVIQIDAEKVQAHLSEIVRGTVEETLNSLLDVEADQRVQGAALRADRRS